MRIHFNSNRSPLFRRYSGIPLLVQVLDAGLERFVTDHLTEGHEDYLAMEEGLPFSFTHLYMASNSLTIDGLIRLPHYDSLQHLDCGSLKLSERPFESLSPRSAASGSMAFSDYPEELGILSPTLFIPTF